MYEYKVELDYGRSPENIRSELPDMLSQQSTEGWEFVTQIQRHHPFADGQTHIFYHFVYKRLIKQP